MFIAKKETDSNDSRESEFDLSLKTIQSRDDSAFKHLSYKMRWQKHVATGGTKLDMLKATDQHVFQQL